MIMQLIIQKCDPVDISFLDEYLNIKDLKVFLDREAVPENYSGLILHCAESGLSISCPGHSPASPTQINFNSDSLQYRLNTSKRSEGLLKAVGLDKYSLPLSIVDGTAGLGTDAYIMAAMGCQVTMLEKSAIMAALLDDGLKRGINSADPLLKSHLHRMTLYFTDVISYLNAIDTSVIKPDVVYLDPMFPARDKSAKVKKDMALMQKLLPANDDVEEMLDIALRCAGKRVVLKRPGKANPKAMKAASPRPEFQVPGKACHFQVYLTV
jgi:16S rRNA (guanine1516-N2)-methyltransferase